MNPFLDALARSLSSTLKAMAGKDLRFGEAEPASASSISGDVSACIEVAAEPPVRVVMTASEGAAQELVREIAGVDAALDDPLLGDTVGELLNVVVGTAQKGAGYMFSLPVVVHERGHTVATRTSAPCARVGTKLQKGDIFLYVLATENAA